MPRGRPRIDLADQRARLLAAGRVQFVDLGFINTNADSISLAAGMSKRTFYDVFSDKSDLLRCLLAQAGPRLMPMPDKAPGESILMALKRMLLLKRDNVGRPDLSDYLLVRAAWEAADILPDLRQRFDDFEDEIAHWFGVTFSPCGLSREEARVLATLITSSAIGGVVFRKDGEGPGVRTNRIWDQLDLVLSFVVKSLPPCA